MLSAAMQVSCRRHLNQPVVGVPRTSYAMEIESFDPDQPFYSQPAALDERIATLTPSEECAISGLPIAQLVVTGVPVGLPVLTLSATDSVSLTTAVIGTYTALSSDLADPEPLLSLATGLTVSINNSNNSYIATTGPHTAGTPLAAGQASFTVQGLTYTSFTLSMAATGVGAYVITQGNPSAITYNFRATGGGGAQTVYGLVPILDYLEARMAGSADFAAFDAVDVITFDPNEMAKRVQQYKVFQHRLASLFFGSHAEQFLKGGRRGRGAIA